MKHLSKIVMLSTMVIPLMCPAIAGASGVPESFRRQAIQNQKEDIQNSAVTNTPVDADTQPGYIQSTARGNLAAYPNAEAYRTFQLNETRAQFLAGPAFFSNGGLNARNQLDVALRYLISPRPWPESDETAWHIGPLPLSLFLELGALPPTNSSSLTHDQTTMIDANTTDQSSLRFNYQAHLALVDELPHGHQAWVIPEIGAGIAVVSTNLQYNSALQGTTPLPPFNVVDTAFYRKEVKNQSLSPYFILGMHLFPEHFISLNLQGSYFKVDFPDSVSIPATVGFSNTPFPGHTLPIDAPSSIWVLAAKIQMKLVWPTLTHTPLIPQLMPPWLLPSYTTEEISPWVAAPEVTKRWNQPGKPSVGNVMFQYKNKWVKHVDIVGDFNDWAPEPLIRDKSGIWLCVKDLPSGKFRYNYILDGKKEILDPWNKNIDSNNRQHGSSIVAVK